MKTLAAGLLVTMCALGGVASAQALPPGNYAIAGTVMSLSGSSCPLSLKSPVTGVIDYPGPGRETTQIVLESIALQKSVTVAFMNAFPAVPANGLNGWSAANTVSPNYTQYQNGKLTGGGTAAILSFDLVQSTRDDKLLAFAQGTMSINVDSISPCKEVIQLIIQKLSGFRQLAE